MAKQKESRLQRRIRRDLERDVGGFWFKVHGGAFQQEGIPDLLGCVEGLYFGFEVKRAKKGRASAIQIETIDDMRKNGGCAMIITSSIDAINAVLIHVEKHYGNQIKSRKIRLLLKRRRR